VKALWGEIAIYAEIRMTGAADSQVGANVALRFFAFQAQCSRR
jgi:hypothetical protein